jgi:HK97 gp10 family phage protein
MSAEISFGFTEDDLVKEVKQVMAEKLEAVGRHLQDAAVRNLGVVASDFQQHSKEGEYPYKQTGNLIRSVHYEVDAEYVEYMGVKVGVDGDDAPYGTDLEYGTEKMKPRRWLGRTLDEETNAVNAILES